MSDFGIKTMKKGMAGILSNEMVLSKSNEAPLRPTQATMLWRRLCSYLASCLGSFFLFSLFRRSFTRLLQSDLCK
jgi:hypothetical protein